MITGAFVEGLRAQARARGGTPEATTDEVLVASFVRDEVLYREAVARGLEDGDPIVRRRLVQAMELVLTTELDVPTPDDAALEAFLTAHPSDFERPGMTSLEHVYFARGPGDAARAAAALEALAAGAEPETLGDPFLPGRSIGPATAARIDATFGPGLSAALTEIELHEWAGPIEGAYGLHLVRVRSREDAHLATLDEVRESVEPAWEAEERARRLELAVDRLVEATPIVRPGETE